MSIYTCNFSIYIVISICAVLLLEAIAVAVNTVWTIKYGVSVTRRNNKVMADIVIETLSAAVPLIIMRFAYGLNFTHLEFIQLGVIPAMFSVFKLHEIVDAIIRERGVIYLKHHKKKSLKSRRLSFFQSWANQNNEDESDEEAKGELVKQLKQENVSEEGSDE